MKPISLTIIDDEPFNVTKISQYLASKADEISIKGAFTNPLKALERLKSDKCDLLLLDIEMPQMNGFELLQKIEGEKPEVIFITSHDEFAIKAIKRSAVDYILKPFGKEEFFESLIKARKRVNQKTLRKEYLDKLSENEDSSKLIIPGTNAYLSITYQDIVYLKAIRGGYTMFYMKDGSKSLATHPLSFYTKLLEKHGFFRCHKSHIVNLDCVEAYEPNMLLARLIGGVELPIATRRKSSFLKTWQGGNNGLLAPDPNEL